MKEKIQSKSKEIAIETNYTQTPVTEELLDGLDKEVRDELKDLLISVEFIRNLASPTRRTIKDMPKDDEGLVIVDFENPHLLKDMDYFRPMAITYKKNGRYTDLFPNPSPASDYRKFWDEQRKRCIHGYVRKSDGEWITGDFYFYLNFCRIPIAERTKNNNIKKKAAKSGLKSVQAKRISNHPDLWDGDYLYFHYLNRARENGVHAGLLKTRGRGYSWKGGALLANTFLFWNNENAYAFASNEVYLSGGDGLLTKAWDIIDDVNVTTAFTRGAQPKTPMERRAAYIDREGRIRGAKTLVKGITLNNDPEKHRGRRGRNMLFEEAGVFPGLERAWDISLNSVEQEHLVYGLLIYFGTGGSKGNKFESVKKMFYTPKGYRVLPIRNVYDKNAGSGLCSFWIGIYMNSAESYDKNGNSDVIKALLQILIKRWEDVKAGVTADTILQRKAETAITPQEAILSSTHSMFPIQDIKDRLADIKSSLSKFISPHRVGIMGLENGEPVFKDISDMTPIRSYPVENTKDRTGAIEIYELPAPGVQEGAIGWRYKIAVDPVRYDEVTWSVSLASIFVFDMFTDNIVAEYTCRPVMLDDFNEQLRRLALYYNASVNFENDITDIFTYFKNNNELMYLQDVPEIVKSMEMGREGRGNRSKGTPSGVKLNRQGLLWVAEWMKEKSPLDDGNGQERNLDHIRSIGLLEEAEQWSPEGNFDRLSALGILMFSRKNDLSTFQSRMTSELSISADDEFFRENFDELQNTRNPNSFNFDKDLLTSQERKYYDALDLDIEKFDFVKDEIFDIDDI